MVDLTGLGWVNRKKIGEDTMSFQHRLGRPLVNSMDLSREEMEESGKCHLNKSSFGQRFVFFWGPNIKKLEH